MAKGIINNKMKTPFQAITAQAGDKDRAYRWYQDAVRRVATGVSDFSSASKTDIGELQTRIEPGNMYMFVYNPKTRDKLPYYDTYPLCLPFDNISGGFVGINFHYLPYGMRSILLQKLLAYSDNKLTEKSRITVNWSLLKGFSKFPHARPAVKKYLKSQVSSRFLKIEPQHWKSALFLPTHNFRKATVEQVHSDSGEIISGR
jgi:hypothetical protein